MTLVFSICCSLCIAGVASGATRAALTQHFALANNAADISAKVHLKNLNHFINAVTKCS
jgi:hypothetical protein